MWTASPRQCASRRRSQGARTLWARSSAVLQRRVFRERYVTVMVVCCTVVETHSAPWRAAGREAENAGTYERCCPRYVCFAGCPLGDVCREERVEDVKSQSRWQQRHPEIHRVTATATATATVGHARTLGGGFWIHSCLSRVCVQSLWASHRDLTGTSQGPGRSRGPHTTRGGLAWACYACSRKRREATPPRWRSDKANATVSPSRPLQCWVVS